VGSVAPTPDGRRLIVADPTGWLKLIDTETGAVLHTVRHQLGVREPFGVSPEGGRLFLGFLNEATDLPTTLFQFEVKVVRKNLRFPRKAVFSPDGDRLAVPDDFSLVLFDGETGLPVATCAGHADIIVDCAFSPGGEKVVSASLDSTLRVWDASDGELLAILRGHHDEVRSLAYSPNGRWIVSASSDGPIRIWRGDADGDHWAPSHSASVRVCAYHPSGTSLLTAGSDGLFKIWDGRSGEEIHVFEGRTPFPEQFASFPGGIHFVSVGNSFDNTPTVRSWETGAVIAELHGIPSDAEGVSFCTVSPDGEWILAGGENGVSAVWERGSGFRPLGHSGPNHATPLEGRFSDSSDLAAVGFDDGRLCLWRLPTWKHLAEFDSVDGGGLSAIGFLPDSTRVISASQDGILHLWDHAARAQVRVISTERKGLSSFSVSPDGRYLLANCQEGVMV